MPRVAEEHLAARRLQILDAARTCFQRDGFHRTSMQQVIAEAGLSVGAVYRYFRSKRDLIGAIADEAICNTAEVFDQLLAREPPVRLADAMDEALALVDTEIGQGGMFPLTVQVWAESLHDPDLAAVVAQRSERMQAGFVALAARARAAGELSPDADINAIGSVLLGMRTGYALQRVLSDGPDRRIYLAGLRAMLDATSQ